MSKRFTILIISFALIITAFLPLENGRAAVSKTTIGTSLENQLRVRSGPGTSFRVLGFLKKGQAVTVLDTNQNWVKISSPFGEGWVAKDFLKVSTPGKTPDKPSSNSTYSGTVTGDLLNVRKDPASAGKIIGRLSKGTKVTIYTQQDGWYQIQFSNQKGWVSTEFIKTDSNPGTPADTSTNGISAKVTASSLSVRNAASLNGKVIGTVTKGQSFTVMEETSNWLKIEYKANSFGWVSSFYMEINKPDSLPEQPVEEITVTVLQDGSNIRIQPTVQADVLQRANAGDTFAVTKMINDWFEIKLKDGSKGYIAGWIVSSSNSSATPIEKPGTDQYLKNKTIILDPGHGGVDNGTTGANGTLEKNLTIKTAKLLYDKLRAAGANVFLTRTNDSYISLPTRVSYAQGLRADAFISLHYDSNFERSVKGMTTYYYHSFQKPLADMLSASIVSETGMSNRGVRFGDFHVIRENSQKAVLIEMGYLSNPNEEITLNTSQFQESVTTGIYNGLARYFKERP